MSSPAEESAMLWASLGLALKLLLVLAAANTAPIMVKRWLGARGAVPLDGGLHFFDGRPLLGPSKTVRGVAAAVAAAAAASALLGLPALVGAQMGLAAMAGDALSSFFKRRLGVPSSGRATGLDQIPEALLPLLVVRSGLGLSAALVAGITAAFVVLEIPLARLWHRLGLREQGY
jgi:hypothetical protein